LYSTRFPPILWKETPLEFYGDKVLKREDQNPFGCFKDRKSHFISYLDSGGKFALASCGNQAYSLMKTNFDVVLVAHYHEAWGIKEVNGVKFVNLGCFGRTSYGIADLTPSVLLIDTDKKELKIIPLKTAKKKEEVFDLDRIKETKEFASNIEDFIRSLESAKFQGLNLRGLVESVAKNQKINREVVDEVITRIGSFEDEEN